MKHDYAPYFRILRFSKPYRVRLVIGILAGTISGGSLFGVLHYLPRLVEVLEGQGGDLEDLGYAGELAQRLNLIDLMPQTDTWQFLLVSVLFVIFFFLTKTIFTYVNKYMMRWVGGRVIVDIRDCLFQTLTAQSLRFYGQSDVGNLITRCINDTAAVEKAVADSIADLTRAPVELIALTAAVIASSMQQEMYFLPLAIFVVMPLSVVPIIVLGRKVKGYCFKAMARVSELTSRMHETFTGIVLIKAYHTEEEEQKRFNYINRRYFKQVLKGIRAELLMTPLMEFVTVILVCLLLCFCYHKGIRLSQILPLMAACALAYDPIRRLAKVNTYLQRSMASAERIFHLLDTHMELPEAENPTIIEGFSDQVCFNNVSFRYDDSRAWVVKDVSLDIPKGKVVAFVGETGSGKSTLANLMARLYDVSEGSVTIDGQDVRSLEIKSLRRLIGYVTQETILFNDTIAYNIAYGSPWATQEQIEAAAKQANCHEFIVSDSQGYEFVVGEKGCNLSGGQRQRISIARAILRNPEILILDEAMSALDTVTEKLVQEALTKLMTNRTVFAIAHRLSTIRDAYKICVVDQGEIVEIGTHAELLARNGRYTKLYESQFA